LSHHTRDELRAQLADAENMAAPSSLGDAFDWISSNAAETRAQRHFVVNKARRQVFETNEDAVALLGILESDTEVRELVRNYPVFERLL